MTDLFRAPSLTQVSITECFIHTFTELVSLLCYTTHLKVLESSACVSDPRLPGSGILKSDTAEANLPSPKSIELHELKLQRHIREFRAWFQWDLCPFEVQNLQVLHLGRRGSAFAERIGLVQYVGKNLKELHLIELLSVDLNNFLEYTPNLRILHLDDLHQTSSWTPVPMIQAFFRPFLNQEGRHLSLQHLIITIRVHVDALKKAGWEQWSAIDGLLQKPEFALLETVDFKLKAHLGFPKIPDGVRQLLRGKLPFLETLGRLTDSLLSLSVGKKCIKGGYRLSTNTVAVSSVKITNCPIPKKKRTASERIMLTRVDIGRASKLFLPTIMMMERCIPNELVDCILENLYFDRDTLLSCALVGSAWVRSSQHGIFREIVLKLPSVQTLMDAYLKATMHLDALFSKKPYLASYVRSLELTLFPRYHLVTATHEVWNSLPPLLKAALIEICKASSVTQFSAIHFDILTFAELASLEEMPVPKSIPSTTFDHYRIIGNSLLFSSINYETLPPLLQAALTEICQAPSVTRFSAIQFDRPTFAEMASLFSCMRNLKVLDVGIIFHDWNMPDSLSEADTKPRRIQLSELRLMSSLRLFMTWFRQDWYPFEVRNLNSLEIISLPDIAVLWHQS
ncbi:hypothetical protein BT96DRAFT_995452 [Gymnopus androsaceus JB14]|uniref:Uncharacterized protein n=1 Tax=Gymnopus androsaceus JB14 TaxID=1447944 RepID=A0A6A4HK43_9AGAR|nr:hypothetical protein BT96DRAFT_995452 [Gymnopus androsaceus JB14]